MVTCSCIPPPASLKPRKIYNFLVPDVFTTLIPPKIDDPITTGLKRKYSKLQEYVCKNPSKAAKVSRRLTRRIKKSLYDRQLGFVKVAVHAYIYLIEKSTDEDSSYTFNYFSKELIHQPDTVIHTLLTYPRTEVQTLGADLLAAYIHAQSEVDHQAEASTSLVECVVKLPAAAKARAASAPAPSGADAEADAALVVACLGALREYVALCQRIRILPTLLEQIEILILDSVEADPRGTAWLKAQALAAAAQAAAAAGDGVLQVTPTAGSSTQGASTGGARALQADSTQGTPRALVAQGSGTRRGSASLDGSQRGAGSMTGGALAGAGPGSKAGELAVDVLRNFRPFLQDISSVRRVMEALLGWLDARGRWARPDLVEGLLALVRRAAGELTFPVTSALMRHAAVPGLPAQTRTTVVKFAVEQGAVYPLSALSLAFAELPRAVAAAGGDSGADELSASVLAAVAGLARQVGDAGQVAEALAVALKGHAASGGQEGASDGDVAVLEAALEAGIAAVNELPSFGEGARHFPGRTLPASLLHTLTPLVMCPPTHRGVSRIARRLLAAVLPSIGGPLRDDKQAVHLAQLARAVLLGAPSTPPDHLGHASDASLTPEEYVIAGQYLETVVGCGKPAALLAAAHVGLEVSGGVAEGGAAGSKRSAAATLLLCSALAQQLAVAGNCPQLAQECKAVPEASSLASELSVVESGHSARLHAPSLSWGAAQPHASSGGSAEGLAAAAAKWRQAFRALLCEAGVLASEHGAQLPLLLDQLLPPPTLPAGPIVALGSAGLLSPSSRHGLNNSMGGAATGQPPHAASGSGNPADGADGSHAGPADAAAGGALQQRLAAQAWGVRAQTLKRERLNLARVMDLLAPGEGESDGGSESGDEQEGSGADAVAALLRGGSGQQPQPSADSSSSSPSRSARHTPGACSSVDDVLAVLQQVGAGNKGAVPAVRVADLAKQLEPVLV